MNEEIIVVEEGNEDTTNYVVSNIFRTLFYGVICYCLYNYLIFRPLPNFNDFISKCFVIGNVALVCTIKLVVYSKEEYETFDILVDLITGFGIYTICAYQKVLSSNMMIILNYLSLTALIYMIWDFIDVCIHKEPLLYNVIQTIFSGLKILSFAFLIIFIEICSDAYINDPSIAMRTQNLGSMQVVECKLDDYINELVILDSDEWNHLNVEEKAKYLQIIANIERTYLGLPHSLTIKVCELEGIEAAEYQDSIKTIFVDEKTLEEQEAYEMVRNIAHEAYHAYQERLIDLYQNANSGLKDLMLFDNVKTYVEELETYVGPNVDVEAYDKQLIETKADSYALTAYYEYKMRISEYVDNNLSK